MVSWYDDCSDRAAQVVEQKALLSGIYMYCDMAIQFLSGINHSDWHECLRLSFILVLPSLAAMCPHPGLISANPLTRHTKIGNVSCWTRSTLDSVAPPEPHPLHECMRSSLGSASPLQGLEEAPGVLVRRHIVLQARCSTYR